MITVLLAKTKSNSIEILFSKTLIDSNISHDEFASVNMLKNMRIWNKKSKILNFRQSIQVFKLFIKWCYLIHWNVEKIQKVRLQIQNTQNGRIMLSSNCTVCNSKKLRFIKEHEARGLLSRLRIKTL